MTFHFFRVRFLISGFHGGEIGFERGGGIDRDDAIAGKVDHEIRALWTSLVSVLIRRVEIAVLLHARELDHALQLHFAPASAACGLAERLDKLGSFLLQADVGLGHLANLRAQRCLALAAGLLQIPDSVFDFRERRGDGSHEGLDRHPALFLFAGGDLLLGVEG